VPGWSNRPAAGVTDQITDQITDRITDRITGHTSR
jgi:hypothetical protein